MKAGWHLWNVALSGTGTALWVTTYSRSLGTAVKKATPVIDTSYRGVSDQGRHVSRHP